MNTADSRLQGATGRAQASREENASGKVTHPAAIAAAAGHVLSSTELLQGSKSVLISHRGELYRLQSTRQGKLILTK